MKKIYQILLSLVLIVSFTACNKNNPKSPPEESNGNVLYKNARKSANIIQTSNPFITNIDQNDFFDLDYRASVSKFLYGDNSIRNTANSSLSSKDMKADTTNSNSNTNTNTNTDKLNLNLSPTDTKYTNPIFYKDSAGKMVRLGDEANPNTEIQFNLKVDDQPFDESKNYYAFFVILLPDGTRLWLTATNNALKDGSGYDTKTAFFSMVKVNETKNINGPTTNTNPDFWFPNHKITKGFPGVSEECKEIIAGKEVNCNGNLAEYAFNGEISGTPNITTDDKYALFKGSELNSLLATDFNFFTLDMDALGEANLGDYEISTLFVLSDSDTNLSSWGAEKDFVIATNRFVYAKKQNYNIGDENKLILGGMTKKYATTDTDKEKFMLIYYLTNGIGLEQKINYFKNGEAYKSKEKDNDITPVFKTDTTTTENTTPTNSLEITGFQTEEVDSYLLSHCNFSDAQFDKIKGTDLATVSENKIKNGNICETILYKNESKTTVNGNEYYLNMWIRKADQNKTWGGENNTWLMGTISKGKKEDQKCELGDKKDYKNNELTKYTGKDTANVEFKDIDIKCIAGNTTGEILQLNETNKETELFNWEDDKWDDAGCEYTKFAFVIYTRDLKQAYILDPYTTTNTKVSLKNLKNNITNELVTKLDQPYYYWQVFAMDKDNKVIANVKTGILEVASGGITLSSGVVSSNKYYLNMWVKKVDTAKEWGDTNNTWVKGTVDKQNINCELNDKKDYKKDDIITNYTGKDTNDIDVNKDIKCVPGNPIDDDDIKILTEANKGTELFNWEDEKKKAVEEGKSNYTNFYFAMYTRDFSTHYTITPSILTGTSASLTGLIDNKTKLSVGKLDQPYYYWQIFNLNEKNEVLTVIKYGILEVASGGITLSSEVVSSSKYYWMQWIKTSDNSVFANAVQANDNQCYHGSDCSSCKDSTGATKNYCKTTTGSGYKDGEKAMYCPTSGTIELQCKATEITPTVVSSVDQTIFNWTDVKGSYKYFSLDLDVAKNNFADTNYYFKPGMLSSQTTSNLKDFSLFSNSTTKLTNLPSGVYNWRVWGGNNAGKTGETAWDGKIIKYGVIKVADGGITLSSEVVSSSKYYWMQWIKTSDNSFFANAVQANDNQCYHGSDCSSCKDSTGATKNYCKTTTGSGYKDGEKAMYCPTSGTIELQCKATEVIPTEVKGADTDKIVFDWTDVKGSYKYFSLDLDVAKNNFADTNYYFKPGMLSSQTTSNLKDFSLFSNSTTKLTNLPSGVYNWRVWGGNNAGKTGETAWDGKIIKYGVIKVADGGITLSSVSSSSNTSTDSSANTISNIGSYDYYGTTNSYDYYGTTNSYDYYGAGTSASTGTQAGTNTGAGAQTGANTNTGTQTQAEIDKLGQEADALVKEADALVKEAEFWQNLDLSDLGDWGYGGSGSGGASCFPAGSKISMANNGTKNIEEVKIGDLVYGYNEITKQKEIVKVLELESPIRDHMCEINFTNGKKLKLTDEHPIYGKDGWKAINPKNTMKENVLIGEQTSKLNKEDEILLVDNSYATVLNFICWQEKVQTYNLKTVEKLHTFYANDVLVHNKGGHTLGNNLSKGSSNSKNGGMGMGNGDGAFGANVNSTTGNKNSRGNFSGSGDGSGM